MAMVSKETRVHTRTGELLIQAPARGIELSETKRAEYTVVSGVAEAPSENTGRQCTS